MTDPVIITTTDALSRAASRIAASSGNLSKNTVLNILAAEIAGPRHNWGFLKGAKAPVIDPRVDRGRIPAPSRVETPDSASEAVRHAFTVVAETQTEFLEAIEERALNETEIEAAISRATALFLERHRQRADFGAELHRRGEAWLADLVYDTDWPLLLEVLD